MNRTIFLAFGLTLAGARIAVGCAATPAQKSAEADSTFASDMLECVNTSSTRTQADACRARVRETWHVDGGAR